MDPRAIGVIGCPFCGHFTTVYEQDGVVFVAGHKYMMEVSNVRTSRAASVGGRVRESREYSQETILMDCTGGKLATEYQLAAPSEAPAESVVPEGMKLTHVIINLKTGERTLIFEPE